MDKNYFEVYRFLGNIGAFQSAMNGVFKRIISDYESLVWDQTNKKKKFAPFHFGSAKGKMFALDYNVFIRALASHCKAIDDSFDEEFFLENYIYMDAKSESNKYKVMLISGVFERIYRLFGVNTYELKAHKGQFLNLTFGVPCVYLLVHDGGKKDFLRRFDLMVYLDYLENLIGEETVMKMQRLVHGLDMKQVAFGSYQCRNFRIDKYEG